MLSTEALQEKGSGSATTTQPCRNQCSATSHLSVGKEGAESLMGVLYRPELQWQGERTNADNDPYGWFGCGAHSTAMGIDAVTAGAIVPSGKEVRDLTNEAIPDKGDPGLVLPQLIVACKRFGMHWIGRTGVAWNVAVNDLKQRRWLVINVWYASLPVKYRSQAAASFGHSMGLMAISGDGQSSLLYDPLAKAARWVPLSVLHTAMAEWAKRCGHPSEVIYMATVATIPIVEPVVAS
jgi:hypothetical protein